MIEFRPHHFLCSVGFIGKGYSPEFVRNYQEIVDRLRGPKGDDERIRVTRSADSVCAPCPSRRGKGCESQEKIDRLDDAHAEILKLSDGDELTWGEAKRKIVDSMTIEKHQSACAPCSWRALGVCEKALRKLRE